MFYILYFFRSLQEKFLLVKGELDVPVQFVQANLQYLFVVIRKARGKRNEDKQVWEHLDDRDPLKNRNLVIPKTNLKEGGKFYLKYFLIGYPNIMFLSRVPLPIPTQIYDLNVIFLLVCNHHLLGRRYSGILLYLYIYIYIYI